MPTKATASFLTSVREGRTFVQFRLNKRDVDSLTADLNYATSPGVIASAANVREFGTTLLAYLKSQFPHTPRKAMTYRFKSGRTLRVPGSLNLRAGWDVSFYSAVSALRSAGSLMGFYLAHRQQRNERVSTILNALEHGWKAHKIVPDEALRLAFPKHFPARPGAKNATTAAEVTVPAHRGFHYIEKTEKKAGQLLVTHGNLLERELKRIIEKGGRLRTAALGEYSSPGTALSSLMSQESSITALSDQRNPMRAARRISASLRKRRSSRR